jgi:prenyltransferase beta subunit
MCSNNKDNSKSNIYSKERSFVYLAYLYSTLVKRFNRHYYNIAISYLFKCKYYYKQSYAYCPIPEHILLIA